MDLVVLFPDYKFNKYLSLFGAIFFTGTGIYMTVLTIMLIKIHRIELFNAGIIGFWICISVPLFFFLISITNAPCRIQASDKMVRLTMFYGLTKELRYSDIKIVKKMKKNNNIQLITSQNVVYYLYEKMSDLDKFVELIRSKNSVCTFDNF